MASHFILLMDISSIWSSITVLLHDFFNCLYIAPAVPCGGFFPLYYKTQFIPSISKNETILKPKSEIIYNDQYYE
ncbi:MAG: hypothetical protein R6W90_11395 [Ignavibacteriaceae bacterium]